MSNGVNSAGHAPDRNEQLRLVAIPVPPIGFKKAAELTTIGTIFTQLLTTTYSSSLYLIGSVKWIPYGGIWPGVLATAIVGGMTIRKVYYLRDLQSLCLATTLIGLATGSSCLKTSSIASAIGVGFATGRSITTHPNTFPAAVISLAIAIGIPTTIASASGVGRLTLIAGSAGTTLGAIASKIWPSKHMIVPT